MKAMSTHNAIQAGDLSATTTYQAGILQAMAHRLLQKYCDEVLKGYGITKMQWLIIGAVHDAGQTGIRITDLAELVGTTLPYLTNTINLLESKRILQRVAHGTDSRSKMVTLSPDYKNTVEDIETHLRQSLRKTIYADIAPADFRVYMKVLVQLSEKFKQ